VVIVSHQAEVVAVADRVVRVGEHEDEYEVQN
jgi:hypothetical protein